MLVSQDMLLDTTPLASRSSEQRQLAEEVIMEAKKFRTGFEQLLAQLGQYDTPQANELLTTGLEKLDVLNNSLNVHKEVAFPSHQGSSTTPDIEHAGPCCLYQAHGEAMEHSFRP